MSAPPNRRVVLIGNPIAHSLSPAFQNAAFRAAGITARYDLAEIAADTLPEAVARLRGAAWYGANVTVPYKEAVIPLLDEISDDSRAVGAVNTIINRGGRLIGTNTDVPGFAAALREAGIHVEGQTVVLLGAGGSARAVAAALHQLRAGRLVIANRTLARAQAIAAQFPDAWATAAALPVLSTEYSVLPQAQLVVNTVPVGVSDGASPLTDADLARLPPTATVYDLVYRRTPLLHAAETRGLRSIDGLGMLIHQGARSWEMWTGQPAPLDAMWSAVNEQRAQL